MIQSRLFLLSDDNFIHGALSDLKVNYIFIHLELFHCMKGHLKKCIKSDKSWKHVQSQTISISNNSVLSTFYVFKKM